MREILFRGKRVDGNGWASGSLDLMYDGTPFITFWVSELIEPENNYSEMVCKTFQVHPETVGQFTGLLDKTGKRIFEGSLIKHNKNIYIIKWVDSLLRYRLVSVNHNVTLHARELDWLRNVSKYCEIIGNIHDSLHNPPPH